MSKVDVNDIPTTAEGIVGEEFEYVMLEVEAGNTGDAMMERFSVVTVEETIFDQGVTDADGDGFSPKSCDFAVLDFVR